MKFDKIKNPIFNELLKLKIVSKKNLKKFWNKTRDANVKSYIDKNSGVIFLEKYLKNTSYYKKKITNRKFANNQSSSIIKLKNKKIVTKNLNDDLRRFQNLKKILKNKKILDFGCGKGIFAKLCKKVSKNVYAIEVNNLYIKELKNKINISNNLDDFKDIKFDVITMFHVLEHLPNQTKIIKILLKNLKKGGILIIEVPSAHDYLFKIKNLKSFKNFTMWSEHLILHTAHSLKKFCRNAGAIKIKINFFQRYNFSNHFGWIVDGLPGGHNRYGFNLSINKEYQKYLEQSGQSDTIIATIKK